MAKPLVENWEDLPAARTPRLQRAARPDWSRVLDLDDDPLLAEPLRPSFET